MEQIDQKECIAGHPKATVVDWECIDVDVGKQTTETEAAIAAWKVIEPYPLVV